MRAAAEAQSWNPLKGGAVLSYTNTWRRTPLCGAATELLASVFKQYRTQGRSEFSASVSQQLLTTQTGLLVGTGVLLWVLTACKRLMGY